MESNIMSDFIREMIGGVSNILLNNPIIGWGGSFINIIMGVCALVAITDIILSFGKEGWAEKGIRFIFFFTLVLMNFGVINPRSVFDFQLGSYEYVNKTAVDNKAASLIGLRVSKPKATLDRDIYNALARLFDDLAETLAGNMKNKTVLPDGKVEEVDIQNQAIQNTLYFLYQIRVAKLACYNNGNTPEYINCLKKYVPYEANLGKAPVCKNGAATVPCAIEGAEQVEQGSATGTSDAGSGGWFDSVTTAVGSGLSQLVSMFMGFFTTIIFIFQDFAFVVALPVILWILEIVRNIITLYFVIRYGFQASLTLMFAKIMSPLILIPSKWNDVKSAYMSVFSTALFGFMSKLFVMAATILSLGLHSATYGVIAPRLYGAGSGLVESVKLTAQINGLVYLVYFGIFVVLLMQILSMTKINDACEMFLSFSVTRFVDLGKQVIGGAVNLALAGAAIATVAPLAGGALLAKGGTMALGKAAASKLGAGKAASFLANKASDWTPDPIKNLANRGINSAARAGMNSVGSIVDYGFGEEAGAKARQLLGRGGGVRKSPVSLAPNENQKNSGKGYNELIEDSPVSDSGSTNALDNNSEDIAGASSRGGAFGHQRKNKKNIAYNSSMGSTVSNENDLSNADDRADPHNAFAKAEGLVAKKTKKPDPYKNSRKGPRFLENPAIKAALMAGNLANAWSSAASSPNPFSGAMSGFSSGLGTKIEGSFANLSQKVNKKLDEAYLDDEFREKVAAYNRKIDNIDSDAKLETSINLQNSIQAATSKGSLSSESKDANTLADYSKFEDYQKTIKAGKNLNSEEMKDFSRISSSYELAPNQKDSVQALTDQSPEYKKMVDAQQAKSASLIDQFVQNPTAQNAQSLQDAINNNEIPSEILAKNPKLAKAVAQQNKLYTEEFSKRLDNIDPSRLDDDEYSNQVDVRTTMAEATRFAANRGNVSSLLGSKDLAQNLSKVGMIDEKYAQALSNVENNKELDNVIKTFPDTIKQFGKKVHIGDNQYLRMSNQGEIVYFNNKTIDKEVKNISINDIKNENLKNQLIKQKRAFEIIKNNPNLAEKHQVKTDKLMAIFNFIKV